MTALAEAIMRDAAAAQQADPELRYGQAVFNAAYAHVPDRADALRCTELDPFHDDRRVAAFLTAASPGSRTEPTRRRSARTAPCNPGSRADGHSSTTAQRRAS